VVVYRKEEAKKREIFNTKKRNKNGVYRKKEAKRRR
jgi:hypothetical protein